MMMKTYPEHERGAVLLVGIIVLVVMALLSTAALRGTLLQERTAGSFVEQNQAFQAAEIALRAGEELLSSGNPLASGCLYDMNAAPSPDMTYAEWTQAATCAVTQHYRLEYGADAPRFFIEQQESRPGELEVGRSSETEVYKITALGTGGIRQDDEPTILVVLQSSVTR
jgi:type IV pilus assembly protein PilX